MKKLFKLKKNYQFKTVYEKGRYYAEPNLVLYILKNGTDENKVGFSVSKKVGNSVRRNRAKRLLRENYRKLADDLKKGYDIIFTARAAIIESSYRDVERNMLSALKRAKLLK